MYVCFCAVVTDQAVRGAIDAGARTVDEVAKLCLAGSRCGGCLEAVEAMLSAATRSTGPEGGSRGYGEGAAGAR